MGDKDKNSTGSGEKGQRKPGGDDERVYELRRVWGRNKTVGGGEQVFNKGTELAASGSAGFGSDGVQQSKVQR